MFVRYGHYSIRTSVCPGADLRCGEGCSKLLPAQAARPILRSRAGPVVRRKQKESMAVGHRIKTVWPSGHPDPPLVQRLSAKRRLRIGGVPPLATCAAGPVSDGQAVLPHPVKQPSKMMQSASQSPCMALPCCPPLYKGGCGSATPTLPAVCVAWPRCSGLAGRGPFAVWQTAAEEPVVC